jgi:hypothetical protein
VLRQSWPGPSLLEQILRGLGGPLSQCGAVGEFVNSIAVATSGMIRTTVLPSCTLSNSRSASRSRRQFPAFVRKPAPAADRRIGPHAFTSPRRGEFGQRPGEGDSAFTSPRRREVGRKPGEGLPAIVDWHRARMRLRLPRALHRYYTTSRALRTANGAHDVTLLSGLRAITVFCETFFRCALAMTRSFGPIAPAAV